MEDEMRAFHSTTISVDPNCDNGKLKHVCPEVLLPSNTLNLYLGDFKAFFEATWDAELSSVLT